MIVATTSGVLMPRTLPPRTWLAFVAEVCSTLMSLDKSARSTSPLGKASTSSTTGGAEAAALVDPEREDFGSRRIVMLTASSVMRRY